MLLVYCLYCNNILYLAQCHLYIWPPSPETIILPNTWNRYFQHTLSPLRRNSFVQSWFRQAHQLYEWPNCKNLTDHWKSKEWDKKLNWHKTFKISLKLWCQFGSSDQRTNDFFFGCATVGENCGENWQRNCPRVLMWLKRQTVLRVSQPWCVFAIEVFRDDTSFT